MNRKQGEWRPLSLAQHFDAPDEYQGEYGWVCGFSADAAFMDDAARRFTRLTAAQRAQQGRVVLSLYLDPCNPQVRLQDAPGVAHLPISNVSRKPFRLLHAKVSLLGFRHLDQPERWLSRLVVSTGNWTRQTLEESLDLAWSIEISSEDVSRAKGIGQCCADIQAAWRLFQWLDTLFDTRLLEAGHDSGASSTRNRVKSWINVCEGHAHGTTRLFDNRQRSLFDEVKLRLASSVATRNYLAMGSGFYEAPSNGQARIPGKIVKGLTDAHILTKRCEIDLFVNPSNCQAIAHSVPKIKKDIPGITIRSAAAPKHVFGVNNYRSLHAKFLFAANWRQVSNACSSAWVYLGSGNLTDAGFMQPASQAAGNLEAGVVFFPRNLVWCGGKSVPADNIVTNVLPIQWESAFTAEDKLSPGPEWSPPETLFVAPPVSHFNWHPCNDGGELQVSSIATAEIDVFLPSGETCERTATGYRWLDRQPRSVRIAWTSDRTQNSADVPVVDEYGRIAATVLPSIDLEAAWWQLADFPMPPEAEAPEWEYDQLNGVEMDSPFAAASPVAFTPIRQMMQLVENISARQTEVGVENWRLWCNQLEQILGQARDCTAVKEFAKLKLNPLSPLRMPPFRPAFAEDDTSEAGRLYEETLTRVELLWGLKMFSTMGGQT